MAAPVVAMEVVKFEVPPQARRYVDDSVWDNVVLRVRYNGCDSLAWLARTILDGRRGLHRLAGYLMGLPVPEPERELARQLGERIPLPTDELAVAVSRGLQLTGIVACVSHELPMSECACYRDVVKRDLKPMVKRLYTEGVKDWSHLGALTPAG